MTWFFTLAAGALASVLSLKFVPVPYVSIALLWSLLLLRRARRARDRRLASGLLCLAATAGALGAAEAVFWRIDARRASRRVSLPEGYREHDELLGVVPRSSFVARARRQKGEELIYDVTYSIGSDGLRRTSSLEEGPGGPSLLFFGGVLHVRGERGGRREPAVLRRGTGKRRVPHSQLRLLGVWPQHMLAALQTGRVARTLTCQPDFVVYQAIPDHVRRASGKVAFAKGSPRYVQAPSGRVELAGRFGDEQGSCLSGRPGLQGWLVEKTAANLRKSFLFRHLSARRPPLTESDIDLFVRIVTQARDAVEATYPGCRFHVLLWHVQRSELALHDELRARLTAQSIPVHLVADILPGYREGSSPYELSPHDRHPNARAYRLLAEAIVRSIVAR